MAKAKSKTKKVSKAGASKAGMSKTEAKEIAALTPAVYCSLDIETSDFSAETGEILELGMVFFTIENQKINFIQEWQSTFKPAGEVSPKILALTGITMEELETAPLFRDKSEEIQALVKDCVILGHNINFDTAFLQSFGIKFSGKYIDTLDLAQMFLPTQTSYNLEALMHLFQVSHANAHRALADAQASVVVFERLFGLYATFPKELREKLVEFFKPKAFGTLRVLLETDFKPQDFKIPENSVEMVKSKGFASKLAAPRQIYTFPLGYDYYSHIFGNLKDFKEKLLVVVPQKKIVYQLWRQKAAYPIFSNIDLFDAEVFAKSLEKVTIREQRIFYAKIMIWHATNWQNQALVDLNFSFNGSQFHSDICGSAKAKPLWDFSQKEKIVVCDYADFIGMDLEKEYADRQVLVLDINNFEQALTLLTSKRASWNDFIYALKQVYDPSAKRGKKEFAETVSNLLSQTDLFFGLANLHAKKIDPSGSNVLVRKDLNNNESFNTIIASARNYVDKLEEANNKFKSEKLKQLTGCLKEFLVEQPNIVRWMEFYENRFVFAVSPLDLSEIAQNKLKNYHDVSFTASLGSDQLVRYFTDRLGISGFGLTAIGHQQELRNKVEVVMPIVNSTSGYNADELLPLLEQADFPAALLLSGGTAVMNFYEANFKQLQKRYHVSAMGFSGGTTKLLANFSIHPNSLLLASDNFVLKQVNNKLKVKTLIMTRLPFEQFNHPLFIAQAEKYTNQFIDFNIPRALHNFHSIIRFFYGPDLEKIYILDGKINKEYGKYFVDYLKSLPFVVLK